MDEHENINVRCLTCSLSFMTSLDSYEKNESCCPACGYGDLVTRLPGEE